MDRSGPATPSSLARSRLRRLLILAALLLAASAAADVHSTSLAPLGWHAEANPIARAIWRDEGFAALCALKVALLGIVLLAALATYVLDGAAAALARRVEVHRRLVILVARIGTMSVTALLFAGAASWLAFAARNYFLAGHHVLAGLSLAGAAISAVTPVLGLAHIEGFVETELDGRVVAQFGFGGGSNKASSAASGAWKMVSHPSRSARRIG